MINIKKANIAILFFLPLFACNKQVHKDEKSYVKYVDPFIGTSGHGHTYPGATVPFGMLQVSPDNGISEWDWCSGYHYSDSITIGFSHLHLSGTGIGDLADIRLMPINKKVDLTKNIITRDDIPYKSSYSHTDEVAKAGYYSVFLKDHHIKAELTSALRTAFHQYTYKEEDLQSVILDLGFNINWDKAIKTQINIEDKFTVTGYRNSKGWASNQKVFFVIKFSKSIKDYELASNKKLLDPKVRLRQLERMLIDPRAKGFVEDFLGQWLWLETLGDMPPSKKDKLYYKYNLEKAMAQETYLFTEDLLKRNGPLENLLDADYTFVNEGLAALYGISGVTGEEFRKVELQGRPERGGLMGQASVLTVTGNGVESLPVTRGVWILENIMGTPPPPPPPDVPEIAPDTSGTQTVRDLLAKHREDFSCNECHKKMDPFGLAMEGYDYLGRYREHYGHKSKSKNKINLAVQSHDGVNFEGLPGVKQYIKSKPDMFTRCLTEKLLTYAVGRKMVFTDRRSIDAIVQRAKKEGFGLRDLMKLIVLSEVFITK